MELNEEQLLGEEWTNQYGPIRLKMEKIKKAWFCLFFQEQASLWKVNIRGDVRHSAVKEINPAKLGPKNLNSRAGGLMQHD